MDFKQIIKSSLKFIKKYRAIISIVIIAVMIVVFVLFFVRNPQYLTTLRNVKLSTILWIIGLNALLIATLAVIYQLTLKMCGSKLPFKEQLLLTSYSSIANFFGPLQSGPGVRAVYLKTKHGVRMRDYTLATLIYYAIFATVNVLLLLGGSRAWWRTFGIVLVTGVFCYFVIDWYIHRDKQKVPHVLPTGGILLSLLLAVFVQVALVATYYGIELHAVGAHASLHQILVYTGAANLAVFVSLTPDAIGFREAFLIFSQHLHGISTANILAANVLDRAVYAVFLGLLFLIVLAVHGQDKFKRRPARSPKPTTS